MTLYHFGNCLALLYAPYHMAYKYSGIAEYGLFTKCVYSGVLYMFTQLCKMLLLATFFPDSDNSSLDGQYDIFMEILKATVDFADLIGLYFALNSVMAKGHTKIFTAAIGWASAEVVLTRAVPLWSGARGAEWSWRHVRASAAGSVSLAATCAAAALVWLWGRHDLPRAAEPLLAALLLLTPYRGLLADCVSRLLALSAWGALLVRATHAAAASLAALAMYALLDQHVY